MIICLSFCSFHLPRESCCASTQDHERSDHMKSLCIFGYVLLISQFLINTLGMYDQYKKLCATRYTDNISLKKWVYIWIALAAGAIHTSVEMPNMFVFFPIIPGLILTTLIIWQILSCRHPRLMRWVHKVDSTPPATSSAK